MKPTEDEIVKAEMHRLNFLVSACKHRGWDYEHLFLAMERIEEDGV